MANEDDRAGGAGERRSYRGGVIGDSIKMVLGRYDLETISQ
jgi:hypothetical protein